MMASIEDRETNLYNATDTLAQFYGELESFMGILSDKLKQEGFARAEKLRSGTLRVRHLPRRLLASAMVVYVKDKDIEDVEEEDEVEEEHEDEGVEIAKAEKNKLMITPDLRVPFVTLFLFSPNTTPRVRTLESPKLLPGALGNMRFVEKKTDKARSLESPSLPLNNLARVRALPDTKVDGKVVVGCQPRAMRQFKLETTLVGFESRRLLEIDTEDKIVEIAAKLAAFWQK
jgi:hypothetical protein